MPLREKLEQNSQLPVSFLSNTLVSFENYILTLIHELFTFEFTNKIRRFVTFLCRGNFLSRSSARQQLTHFVCQNFFDVGHRTRNCFAVANFFHRRFLDNHFHYQISWRVRPAASIFLRRKIYRRSLPGKFSPDLSGNHTPLLPKPSSPQPQYPDQTTFTASSWKGLITASTF